MESGNLTELMHMCGHILHHRPEAGAARGQAKILSILANEGSISQRHLQEMLRIQPGSMSETVTKLENKGFIVRTRCEDRRGNMLQITDAGREAAAKEESAPEDLFSSLNKAEQAQLRALLQTLLTDWIDRFDRPARNPRGHR